jgi:hypothetical protein
MRRQFLRSKCFTFDLISNVPLQMQMQHRGRVHANVFMGDAHSPNACPQPRLHICLQSHPNVVRYAINISVFHVNPATYGVAPINMNTADLLGDMYFDMRSKALPIECANGTRTALPFSIPSFWARAAELLRMLIWNSDDTVRTWLQVPKSVHLDKHVCPE